MFKKLIIIIISTNFLLQCGFTPMYSSKNGNINNVSINEISFIGDKIINNGIEANLIRYKNSKNEKPFNIKIDTKFSKETLTKDKTAKVTDYKLSSVTIFEISSQDQFIKRIIISEEKNMNNMSDKFEEQKYERSIKQNFASSISSKIITELSLLNDN
tara:strand:+ start:130 stop:603 length:474 start_codon:yes stop_codon:yes gene_type:complete